jgi:hypothetical protein
VSNDDRFGLKCVPCDCIQYYTVYRSLVCVYTTVVVMWRQYTVQAFALQVCYSAHVGNYWLTFIVLLPGCCKGDQQRLRKNPEEWRPHVHRDGSLKSSIVHNSVCCRYRWLLPRRLVDIFSAVCSVMIISLLLIQTDLVVFDILSSAVDNTDAALVNK